MSKIIDYYFAPQSPWTYLGHARFVQIAKAAGARVQIRPADLGKVFSVSGGLPLAQRPEQRKAYRLVELARFSRFLNMPMNVQPKFFPVAGDPASSVIIAVDRHDGIDAALRFAGAVFNAVWEQERNIADQAVLAQLLDECQLDPARLAQAQGADILAIYQGNTEKAIAAGVFGAPSFVVDGEIFWGQDRLDFLQRRLQA